VGIKNFIFRMTQFQVTLKQQLLVLIPFIFINTLLVLGYFLILGSYPVQALEFGIISFLFITSVLPVIILHIQYLYYNNNAVLNFEKETGRITFKNGETKYVFFREDILVFKYYATTGYFTDRDYSAWYSFCPYRFYKIILNNGTEIIITCLMINDIDYTFEEMIGLKAERKFRLIPFVF
jgi:hypothetical protein